MCVKTITVFLMFICTAPTLDFQSCCLCCASESLFIHWFLRVYAIFGRTQNNKKTKTSEVFCLSLIPLTRVSLVNIFVVELPVHGGNSMYGFKGFFFSHYRSERGALAEC